LRVTLFQEIISFLVLTYFVRTYSDTFRSNQLGVLYVYRTSHLEVLVIACP